MTGVIMDYQEFEDLSRLAKLDYIIECLHKAHDLFRVIYDSGCGLDQALLDELEHLGGEFSRIGLLAEEGYFAGLYEELNDNLAKLNGIVALVKSYIIRNRIIN